MTEETLVAQLKSKLEPDDIELLDKILSNTFVEGMRHAYKDRDNNAHLYQNKYKAVNSATGEPWNEFKNKPDWEKFDRITDYD